MGCTSIYLHWYTSIHHHAPQFTFIQLHTPSYTFIHLNLPSFFTPRPKNSNFQRFSCNAYKGLDKREMFGDQTTSNFVWWPNMLMLKWVAKRLKNVWQEHHAGPHIKHIPILPYPYLTIILRNRAEYRLILSRRGRRPGRLKSDDIPRDWAG